MSKIDENAIEYLVRHFQHEHQYWRIRHDPRFGFCDAMKWDEVPELEKTILRDTFRDLCDRTVITWVNDTRQWTYPVYKRDEHGELIRIGYTESTLQISNGLDTFDDLYGDRNRLWVLLLRTTFASVAYKTRKNRDGEDMQDMFIAGIPTDAGIMAYVLPATMWDLLPNVREIEQDATVDSDFDTDNRKKLDLLIVGD